MDMETNVNSEMSDLVHKAEDWVRDSDLKQIPQEGLNRIPENSFKELRLHKLEKQIVTRAALMLLEQLGINTVAEFTKQFGETLNLKKADGDETIDVVRNEDDASLTISPMDKEEFYNILKNGGTDDGLQNSPEKLSPNEPKRRNSILADLIPMSPIASETSPKKTQKSFYTPLPPRRSAPNPRRLFNTSTPISAEKTPRRRAYSMGKPATPISATPKTEKVSPSVLPGEGPLENRASRLRRLKMEERRASGGLDRSFKSYSSLSISSDCVDTP